MPFVEGIPTVVVTLDKPRTLGFTMGSVRRVQERLGTLEVDTGSVLALPTYIWACLDAEDRKELSVEQIEDMIHPGNLNAISDTVAELMGASTVEKKEGTDQTPGPTIAMSA